MIMGKFHWVYIFHLDWHNVWVVQTNRSLSYILQHAPAKPIRLIGLYKVRTNYDHLKTKYPAGHQAWHAEHPRPIEQHFGTLEASSRCAKNVRTGFDSAEPYVIPFDREEPDWNEPPENSNYAKCYPTYRYRCRCENASEVWKKNGRIEYRCAVSRVWPVLRAELQAANIEVGYPCNFCIT